ncbi:beta-microseminoprotein-like [Sinocyclocheilus grahami]|uniref:beta-microseminoprotein-like n=1 Tax=Sinocyclocheilus grahami TaxID=75366 RepID=UPI0007AD482C|nr:PREDICTED: beta-microseminoprotein-like [Sinocyclocheilus grahami]
MATSLALVLVFCAFVSLSESACFFMGLKLGEKHCVDDYDNSKHPMGSAWTNGRCVSCTCSSSGMKCSSPLNLRMGRVTSMTKGCIVKYDYKTCTVNVFHPEDPTIKCSYGAVGK